MPQMGFFDLSDRYASLNAKKDALVEINAVVPWDTFRPVLERVGRKPDAARKSRAGRKGVDAVLMVKTLVLSAQQPVRRSDPVSGSRPAFGQDGFLGWGPCA